MTSVTRDTVRTAAVVLVALAVLGAGAAPAAALYSPMDDGDVDPDPNPPYPQQCGADVMLVLDTSASLDQGNLTDVQRAANDTVDVLAQTDAVSGVGVVSFKQRLDGSDGANTAAAITELDSSSDVQSVKDAIGTLSLPESETLTNWEAALLEATESENDDDGDVANEDRNKPADIVIFVSDGDPNAYGYPGLNGTGQSESIEAATLAANVVKGEDTRVVGVGFPGEEGGEVSRESFRAITNGSNSVAGSDDDQENDYYIVSSSSELDATLTDIASEIECGISVEKLNDANNDSTFTDDETAPFPGDDVTYKVTVTNTGQIDLSLDDYTDDVYGEPTLNRTLKGETLPAGESVTVTFVGTAPPENGVKTNVFTVNASDEDGFGQSAEDDTTVRSPDLTPSISVAKTVDADGDGSFNDTETANQDGEAVTYRVTVTNDGPNNVTLDSYSDSVYGEPTLNQTLVGTELEPGESTTVTFEGSAPELEGDSKTNEFTVNASDGDGDEATDSDTATVVAPDFDPSIAVTKTVDADGDGEFSNEETANQDGEAVTYQVTVTNDGPNNVTIEDYDDSIYGEPTLNQTLVGETLAPGDSITVSFEGTAPELEGDSKTNVFTVEATDENGDEATDDDNATVVAPDFEPSIDVNKTNDANEDGAFTDTETANDDGQAVTYQVTVTNDGSNSVEITDYSDDVYGEPTLNQTLVGTSLEPGESITVTFEGTAPELEGDSKTNVFTVNATDENEDRASDSDDATVVAPDFEPSISVNKTNDANEDGAFTDTETANDDGQAVTYQVTITNDGPNSVEITGYSDSVYGSPTLNQSLVGTTLDPGESITVTFDGSAPELEGDSKTNIFTVNASDENEDKASDGDDATVIAPDFEPSISVNKTNDANEDGAFTDTETANDDGQAVTYQVTITNDGPNSVKITGYNDSVYGTPTLNQTLVGETLASGDSITVTFEGSAPELEGDSKTNIFTVNASDENDDRASDRDDATVIAPDFEPSISVNKTSDANEDGAFTDTETANDDGQAVTYQVTVTNDGSNSVTIDDYSDSVYGTPTLNQTLVGTSLEPGESITVTFEGSAPELEGDSKTNVFTVNASDENEDRASDSDDATVVAPDFEPSISVNKTNDANEDGAFTDTETANDDGQAVTYQVTITNDGPNSVEITGYNDSVYGTPTLNQTLVGETLASGDSITVTFEGSAPELEGDSKTNVFSVNASDENEDRANDTDDATVVAPDFDPSISVNKTNDANEDGAFTDTETANDDGQAVTYQVTVTNDGPNSVTVEDYDDSVYGEPTLNQTLVGETLASGESITVTFEGSAPELEGDSKTNVFSVNASDENEDRANDTDDATVVAPDFEPSISVTKEVDADGDGEFADTETANDTGDPVTYRVTVTNTGDNSVNVTGYSDDTYDPDLEAELNGTELASGESTTVTFEGSAPELEGDSKTNEFTVEATDENGDTAADSDTATVVAPDFEPSISVNKTNDANEDGAFTDTETANDDGQAVTYQVTVTNDGPNNVTVEDYDDSVYGEPTLNQTLVGETLASGDSITVTFEGSAPELEGDSKTNEFSVNASDENEDRANDTDDATVVAPDFEPSIGVTKEVDADGDGTFNDTEEANSTGDAVTYRVTVTNDGPNSVTVDAYVDDVYGTPTLNQSLVDETLAPGESIAVTFEGSAPEEENASKTNTFTVNASDENGDEASDDDTATVTTPDEADVCPRTPGFWETHNGDYATGNNPDLTTDKLPIYLGDEGGEKTVLVDDDDTVNDVFNAQLTDDSSKSNMITKLYIHLLAAKFNVENGAAVPDDVRQAIDRSDELLAQYDESDWREIKRTDKELASELESLKDTLDAYNNGELTDDDCIEDFWKDDEDGSTASVQSPSAVGPVAVVGPA